jgi:hypothetical protein
MLTRAIALSLKLLSTLLNLRFVSDVLRKREAVIVKENAGYVSDVL